MASTHRSRRPRKRRQGKARAERQGAPHAAGKAGAITDMMLNAAIGGLARWCIASIVSAHPDAFTAVAVAMPGGLAGLAHWLKEFEERLLEQARRIAID